jgi:hypothetical protein
MKFYKYKQVQGLTFFGFDDAYIADESSLSKRSPQSTTGGVNNDTKVMRFDINRLSHTQLSPNAKIVIEQLYLPGLGVGARGGPITIRMNNLNTHVHDSQNKGFNSTLLYTTENAGQTFQNPFPEILHNFSIPQNFFQNGYVEFTITYPDNNITVPAVGVAPPLGRFYISLVVYDVDEQEILLKDTPDVDYKNFTPHVNFHNGRIPK